MKKPELYGIIAGIFLIFIVGTWASIERQGRIREKKDRERLQYNQTQLLQENQKYIKITQSLDEFKKGITARLDSMLKADKIKPRQVTNVIERTYYYRDTSHDIISPLPVITPSGELFPFTDVKDCFTISGYLALKDQRPILTITDRQFDNTSIDIAYLEREKKFWFIRYGKWRAKLKQSNRCGSSCIKEIEVIKNRNP